MSTYLPRRVRSYNRFALPEFSGGLNIRDAATELALNESPDLMNVVVDERGGIQKRLGYTKWNASATDAKLTYGYYSRVADKILHYSASNGKLYSDPGTGVLTLRRTWTSGSRIGICDFAGLCYANHPVDGLYSSPDGIVWTLVVAASGTIPKGDLLAAWQNKLWVSGDPNAIQTVYFSAAGDATKWDAASGAGSNAIREGRDGDAPIVCLFGATGSDFATHPSLLAYKQRSTHRITDATTAAFVTIDATNGAAGQCAVTSAYGRIYSVTGQGIFETDGFTPLVPVGQKLDPKFTDLALDYSHENGFSAGAQHGRLLFSLAGVGSSGNDICFEYHPLFKSFTARSDAMTSYVTYHKSADILIGYSPSVTGQAYKMNNGGSDDGVDIRSWFLSLVFEPLGGLEARLQKVAVRLGGTVQMQVLSDFTTANDVIVLDPDTGGTGFVWGSGAWGTGVFGGGVQPEGVVETWPREEGGAFQLRFDETSSLTRTAAALLEGAYAPTIGAWSIYGVDMVLNALSVT